MENYLTSHDIYSGNCLEIIQDLKLPIDLTFLDPPFNQQKDYAGHNDNLTEAEYWGMMSEVCGRIFEKTSEGGVIYFMQREKNTEQVLRVLRATGWYFQNLVVWKKMTSAVPGRSRYGKAYQIICVATKGSQPRVFNRLIIELPTLKNDNGEKEKTGLVTDYWDDIRELTSGYFAGDEALRRENGERFHKQQAPIALLLRIILSSSSPGDMIFDPFAGTGTTGVAAKQLGRNSISMDSNPENCELVERRITDLRQSDRLDKYYPNYQSTPDLSRIWGDFPAENNLLF